MIEDIYSVMGVKKSLLSSRIMTYTRRAPWPNVFDQQFKTSLSEKNDSKSRSASEPRQRQARFPQPSLFTKPIWDYQRQNNWVAIALSWLKHPIVHPPMANPGSGHRHSIRTARLSG